MYVPTNKDGALLKAFKSMPAPSKLNDIEITVAISVVDFRRRQWKQSHQEGAGAIFVAASYIKSQKLRHS